MSETAAVLKNKEKRPKRRSSLNKDYYGYFFIAPFIIAFLVFGLYPVFNTIYLSFTDATLLGGDPEWVGLKNFRGLFATSAFMDTIRTTWWIWILNFIPQMVISMLFSMWFTSNRLKIKAVGIWRTIFYLPNVLMPASVAALFASLFAFFGPVNQIMVRNGFLEEAMHFLQNENIAQALVVSIQTWMWFGPTILLLMAGLSSIPVSLYESAEVDGATERQMLTRITLPLLKPVLVFIFVTSLVGGMQMFDIPYLLTDGRGSPSGSIRTNNIFMYMRFSSSQGHIGIASAVGVVVFIMTCVVALGIFYVLRDRD